MAVEEWSVDNVGLCWQRQQRILRDIWPCLKPGGLLIYSTCTYNREENEDNVAWIARELGAEILPVPVEESWQITGNLTGHLVEDVIDEFDADDETGDVQPMEPDEIIEAVRNGEAREVLAAANETMAAQLKAETDKLLDSVLYTTSMNMKNGFHMSDF